MPLPQALPTQTAEHPLKCCIDYARAFTEEGAKDLLPVRVPFGRGFIKIETAEKIAAIPEFRSRGLIEVQSEQLIILPDKFSSAGRLAAVLAASGEAPIAAVSNAMDQIAYLLCEHGIIKGLKSERCRLTGNWRWENGQQVPDYLRELKRLFGLDAFGTHMNGYSAHPASRDIEVILSVSAKDHHRYGLMAGGNVKAGLTPTQNIREETSEETGGVLRLGEKLDFRLEKFQSRADILLYDMRTIKIGDDGVINGHTRLYSLFLPYGIEETFIPQKKEIERFVRVPLRTLLQTWQDDAAGKAEQKFSLTRFKHAAVMAILYFAIEQGALYNPHSPEEHRQIRKLAQDIHEKPLWQATGRLSLRPRKPLSPEIAVPPPPGA